MNVTMKKKILILFALFLALVSSAQTQFRAIPFDEVLKAAQQEKKIVFVDFYTDWCGPCKMMATKIFPLPEVGEYMNARFVATKINAEKGEGVALAKEFGVKAYPTFIVLDASRKELGRFEGSRSAESLKAELDRLTDPEKAPERIKARYAAGERSADLVAAYAALLKDEALKKRNPDGNAAALVRVDSIVQVYYASLSEADRVKPENMFVYRAYSMLPTCLSTKYMVEHADRFPVAVRAEIDSIARNVLDAAVMSIMSGNNAYAKESLQEVKRLVERSGINADGHLNLPFRFIEEYRKGDLSQYIDFCASHFAALSNIQKAYLAERSSELITTDDATLRKKAARVLRNQLPDLEIGTMYFCMFEIRKLEGKGH